jgi:hypothetical protein
MLNLLLVPTIAKHLLLFRGEVGGGDNRVQTLMHAVVLVEIVHRPIVLLPKTGNFASQR